jgi:hypothetical protein
MRRGDVSTGVADARGRRLDAATGVLAAVLYLVAFWIPGTPPSAADPVDSVTAYLLAHRSSILTSDVLIAIASAVFIWWLGSLRSYLRSGEGGEGRLSAAAFLGGGVGAALALAAAAAQSGIVLHLGQLTDGGLVRIAFDTYNALFTIAGSGFAVLVAGASCSAARSGALPPWTYWSGSIVAGLQIASCAALYAKSGFFASGGALALIAFLTLVAWVIAVSMLIVGRNGVPPVPRAAP